MNAATPQAYESEFLAVLMECCDTLQRYSSWTPRQSVTEFCDITAGGCLKYREECDVVGKHGTVVESGGEVSPDLPHSCWQVQGSGWCSPHKTPWGDAGDGALCSHDNPELCRTHGGPCPCYGCITPQDIAKNTIPKEVAEALSFPPNASWLDVFNGGLPDTKKDYIQEKARQSLCPYSQHQGGREAGSFAQCYLTRREFRHLQTERLKLYTGLYAFYNLFTQTGPAQLIYCLQDPSGSIQFPFYVMAEANGKGFEWKHDSEMKYKQVVARVMRQAEALGRRQEADFYKILNDPSSLRLTPFERQLGVLYAPDGELSAFILGCLLRMAPGALAKLSSAPDPWSYQLELAIPSYIAALLKEIRSSFPKKADIISSPAALQEVFKELGLLDPCSLAPTERLVNLVEWLDNAICNPEVYDPLFGDGWIDIDPANRQPTADRLSALTKKLKEKPHERLNYSSIEPVLSVLLSNVQLSAEDFGKRSRIGYENLFAHLAWRAYSPKARAWIVIPLYAHPFSIGQTSEYKHIAFFLGTFSDADDHGHSLSADKLKDRISAIRLVAKSAAQDYEALFLADALNTHIREILSTPGPRYAHEIERWISNFLNPALKLLLKVKPDGQETAKLLSLRRQLERLHSVVMKANHKRELSENSFPQSVWDGIKAVVVSDSLPGHLDTIDIQVSKLDDNFRGDRDIVEAILLGLSRNSLKYGRRNEAAAIGIKLSQTSDELKMLVTDHGMGLDLVLLDRGVLRPRIGSDTETETDDKNEGRVDAPAVGNDEQSDTETRSDYQEEGKGWSLVQIELLAGLHGGDVKYGNLLNDGTIRYASRTDLDESEVFGAAIVVTLKTTRTKP